MGSAANNTTTELISALSRMLVVLERERAAVAAFDLEAIPLLTQEKQRGLDELAALSDASRRDPRGTLAERAQAVSLFQLVQQRGHANMLLLHSVGKALAAHLGLVDDDHVYNARARRQSAYASRSSRAY